MAELQPTPAELVRRLAGLSVLVVGDLVLDEYLTGTPARVSREAPVLVLDETERDFRAGSAGSPAANIVACGSRATIVGVIGRDQPGERLARSLAEAGIGCEGLVRVESDTATKTRILAQGYTGGLYGRQQILRIDRVRSLPAGVDAEIADRIARLGPRHQAILLSDYRAGVIDESAIGAARATGLPIAVDSQGDLRRFTGVDLVKVNHVEAQVALGTPDVVEHGERLRREIGVRRLVITLGAGGMALFEESGCSLASAARVTEVFDVTGAGDTVIAVLTLGLIGGLRLADAAVLANAAASVVIRRLGVATASPSEILQAVQPS